MSLEPNQNAPRSVRTIRSLSVFGATAIIVSIGVGLGVYDLLGLLVANFGRSATPLPYLLMIIVALPIVLTYADRAALIPGANGAYVLARSGQRLWITYASGWMLMGGYVALVALLAWGAGLHLELGFGLFGVEVPGRLLPLIIIALLAAGNVLGFTRTWSRQARLVTLALLLVLILTLRGLFVGSTVPTGVTLFSTNAPVLQMTLLVSSSLWGVILLLGVRNQVTQRTQSMRVSMMAGVIISGLLGVAAAVALERYGGLLSPRAAPLLTFTAVKGFFPSTLLQILYIVFGFVINLSAIDRVLIDSLHLSDGMANDGLAPMRMLRFRSENGVLGWPLLLVTMLAGLLVYAADPVMLTGLVAVTFFWSTALIHLPDLLDTKHSIVARGTKLPYHPLLPAMTIAISVLMPFNLNWSHSWPIFVWIGGGLLFYSAYARAHGLAALQEDVVTEEEPTGEHDADRKVVLVALTDTRSASNLIEAGLQIARGSARALFVLRVLQVPEQTANDRRQQLARRALESLDALVAAAQDDISTSIQREAQLSDSGSDSESDIEPGLEQGIEPGIGPDAVVVRTLVRIGLDPVNGILEAARAESVDLLLASWSGEIDADEPIPDARINRLMRDAACDVAVLHGKMPLNLEKVVVSAAGGLHARRAVELGASLAALSAAANVRVVYVLTPDSEQEERKAAMQMIEDAVGGLDSTGAIEHEQVRAPSVRAGLLEEAENADLLLVGAYRDMFFRRSQFRGVATHVAAESTTAALIVCARERTRYLLLARIWEFIADPLPALTPERRAVVNGLMRVAARSSIDFYVLIILSSIIATLGLLQNSPAVIIGAMLVAPLMSPILAIAMGMVNGDAETLTGGAEVTAKGVSMAIFVGAVVAMLSPLQTPTNEILARTSPNLLDLLVALASGAAAGYAVSRSEVAAALPGVAIAAALVPPLCVVGYGLGTSQLAFATGALLLFTTNLVAIVFSAALVFVALGFRARMSAIAGVGRGVRLTVVSLLVITAVLIIATVIIVRDLNRDVAVKEVFAHPAIANKATIENLTISWQSGTYIIEATIVTLTEKGLSIAEIEKIEEQLVAATGGPTRLDATVISGARLTSAGIVVRRQADQLFVEGVEEQGGRVLEQTVTGGQYNVVVKATVLEGEPGSMNDEALTVIQQHMFSELGLPVTLRVSVLSGQHIELLPTPTATPNISN